MIVDVSDVSRFTRMALGVFDAMPMAVFGFVEAGADALVNTDPYTDRTGALRQETQAVNINDDVDLWEFDLTMGTPYASYVQDLGFSRFDEVGDLTGKNITTYLTVTMPLLLSR